jgi:transcription elongation factor GreA
MDVFSERSPLGMAIMGHKVGDKLSYVAPNGKTIDVEILSAKPYES